MANNNHLYSDCESRLNTLIGQVTETSVQKYDHWRTLQQAKTEYENMCAKHGIKYEVGAFGNWLEDTYGVRLQRVEGMIGSEFHIADEQKYLIYKLKFS